MKNRALILAIVIILSFSMICFSACEKVDVLPTVSPTPTPIIDIIPTPTLTPIPTPTQTPTPAPTIIIDWGSIGGGSSGGGSSGGDGNSEDLIPNGEIMATFKQLKFSERYDSVAESITMIGYSVDGFKDDIADVEKNKFTKIIIPETYNEKPVIYVDGFCDLEALTAVYLPECVETIGYRAFENCKKLEIVNFPSSLKSIGESAFENCESLAELPISDNFIEFSGSSFKNTAWYKSQADGLLYLNNVCVGNKGAVPNTIDLDVDTIKIAPHAFKDDQNDSQLSTVNFNDKLLAIGEYSFSNCQQLANINIGANSVLQKIDSFAFQRCAITSVVLPEKLTDIGDYAFNMCENLSAVNQVENINSLPQSVVKLGMSVFEGCIALPNLNLPSSLTEIPEALFKGCEKLTTFTIGENITKIGTSAFDGCIGLTEITIPTAVTYIDNNAFSKCLNIKNIFLPKTVIFVGDSAFSGWGKTQKIKVEYTEKDLPYPYKKETDDRFKYYWLKDCDPTIVEYLPQSRKI